MNWYRIIDMAEWPYRLQETFKLLYVLGGGLWCWFLWRRRIRGRSDLRYKNLACSLALAIISAGEVASLGGKLWPFVFGWPKGWYTMRNFWEVLGLLALASCPIAFFGLFSGDRQRWWILLLAILFAFGVSMLMSGEPAIVMM